MTKSLLILLVFFSTPFAGAQAQIAASSSSPVTAVEVDKWRADLQHMSHEMPRYHKNLFHTMTAELSSEDYRASNDPALKLILSYLPRQELAGILEDALKAGGVELAVKRFRDFKSLPINRYAYTEEPLLVVGSRLLAAKKADQALALFKLGAEDNPHSFRAYYALGEAHLALGAKQQAMRNFERSLELSPRNYDVIERLKKLRER